MANNIKTIIGLMSGTSLDGIDAAMIRTDGENHVERVGFYTVPYEPAMRESLRACFGLKADVDGRVAMAERQMTLAHADAVKALRAAHPGAVDLIGFHGQTIDHDPSQRWTWQIGDGALLAKETGVDVIADFRSADVKAGGQGAPFLPLYHRALAHDLVQKRGGPVAILNLGGVGNVTYIGENDVLLAFDTGPGSALINDWVKMHAGLEYDPNGKLAATGTVRDDLLKSYLSAPFFDLPVPKSLDRNAWNLSLLDSLSLEDGAATLTAFTVQSVARALDHLPTPPVSWFVTGGGRHNLTIMAGLQRALGVPVGRVDDMGWDGDAMEAEGFAYLAMRSALGLPLSLPGTTNVPKPMTGGRRWSV